MSMTAEEIAKQVLDAWVTNKHESTAQIIVRFANVITEAEERGRVEMRKKCAVFRVAEEQAELIRLRQVVEDKHKAMNQAEDEWESAYQALRRYRNGVVRQRLMQEEGEDIVSPCDGVRLKIHTSSEEPAPSRSEDHNGR